LITEAIDVTHRCGVSSSKIEATFTNGILSTQNLLQQLRSAMKAAGKAAAPPNTTKGLLDQLKAEIEKRKSEIRAFLTADVLSFVRRLLDRAASEGGEVYLALYELHDPELDLLRSMVGAGKVHLILSTAGSTDPNPKGTPKPKRKPVVWDTENNDARALLHRAASASIQDRTFNNKTPIGHDKFAVYVKQGIPTAVFAMVNHGFLLTSDKWQDPCSKSNQARNSTTSWRKREQRFRRWS
jgi:hypothetical protein